uniref:Uncharacterized protein n=1 Tax=Pyxicephalus adspersus TaxID=30357 RepID=A0AAV2ZTP7_PYXAD|nr:TPA: hypothetical protein GDO54_012953 [Pyxicephalus adspersus]
MRLHIIDTTLLLEKQNVEVTHIIIKCAHLVITLYTLLPLTIIRGIEDTSYHVDTDPRPFVGCTYIRPVCFNTECIADFTHVHVLHSLMLFS